MVHQTLQTIYSGLDDKSLWRAFLDGDKAAFEWIYRKNVQGLYAYGRKLVPSSAVVKDCIQELFVELWNRRNFLSATDNIKFYLFKALKIKIVHAVKDEKRWDDRLTKSQCGMQESVEASYEDAIIENQISQEHKTKLLSALNLLPSRQREVLHLLFFDNMNYEQVSEIMSINVSSAYTLAWKGIRRLKKALRDLVVIVFIAIDLLFG